MMGILAISFAALLMQARTGGAADTPRDVAIRDLVKVENEFAQFAADKDWIVAFKSYFADDGVWFVPVPENTQASLAKLPPEAANAKVEWYPTLSDASAAGDLGFNLGPYRWSNPDPTKPPKRGYFFTIWKRASGQPFRVAVDFGVPMPEEATEKREDWRAVHRRRSPVAAEVAAEVLRTRDADFCAAIRREGTGRGYARYLDREAVLLRAGAPPRRGAKAIRRDLDGTAAVCFTPQFSDVSRSGDLGYTYGAYASGPGTTPAGYYVHVWRREGQAWRLAVDVVNAAPPPAPAP